MERNKTYRKKIRKNFPKQILRILIKQPESVEDVKVVSEFVIIDSPEIISKISNTLELIESRPEIIAACKIPPGFQLHFLTKNKTIFCDLTVGKHKHMVIQYGKRGEKIHYELPKNFETLIRPYLKNIY